MTDKPDRVARVKRTTVALPDDVFVLLQAEAARQNVTPSELVREGVLLRLALAEAQRAGDATLVAVLEQLRRAP